MFFSIIVPVYNGQKYLEECVDSILQQTFRDFELILVDDGSTDQSPAICDGYASRDQRVQVLHQPNGGQTKARQAGLKAAGGEYILYVDADDWIAPGLLEQSYRFIQEHHVDVITYAFSHVSETPLERGKGPDQLCAQKGKEPKAFYHEDVVEPVPEGFYDRAAMEQTIYPCVLLNSHKENMFYTITGKVIRHGLLYEKQMAVDENLRMGEDAACTVGVYLGASGVYVSHTIMYFYRVHQQSVSHRFRMELYDQMADTIYYFERLETPIADFTQQIDRYAMLMAFCLMLTALDAGASGQLSAIRQSMNRPVFRDHIRRAQFDQITIKTRITYFLYRRSCVRMAYWFLAFCRIVKKHV